MYYSWSKEFFEAGKRRLAGDTTRAATTDEVKQLRREAQDLKEVGRAGPRGELLRSLFAAALVATSLSPLARSPASADQYASRDEFGSQTVLSTPLKTHRFLGSKKTNPRSRLRGDDWPR
jgi:hypothetical protein